MTERNTLTYHQKKELHDEYKRRKEQGDTVHQEDLAKWAKEHFDLDRAPSQSTISRILKRQQQNPIAASSFIHKRERLGKNHALEQALFTWVEEQNSSGTPITGMSIRNAAVAFQTKINQRKGEENRVEMKFSNGWLARFQNRWGVKMTTTKKKKAMQETKKPAEGLDKELEGYEPKDVWCVAEMGLCFRMAPSKMVARLQLQGRGKEKGRLACVICCNADGSERWPMMMIGREEKPESFDGKTGKDLGFDYHANRKAWMSAVLFLEWLRRFDEYIAGTLGRKVVLLMRNINAGSSIERMPDLRAVKVVFVPCGEGKNPLEKGVIEAIKVRYRKMQIGRVLDLHDCNAQNVYALDQRTAMQWVTMIWKEITSKMITQCWLKAGLLKDKLPANTHPAGDEVAKLAQEGASLQTMISKVVGAVDRMPLNEFLNSSAEWETSEKLTEEELIESIVDSVAGKEEETNKEAENVNTEESKAKDISKQLEAVATAKIIIETNFPREKGLLKHLKRVQNELRRQNFGPTEQITTEEQNAQGEKLVQEGMSGCSSIH